MLEKLQGRREFPVMMHTKDFACAPTHDGVAAGDSFLWALRAACLQQPCALVSARCCTQSVICILQVYNAHVKEHICSSNPGCRSHLGIVAASVFVLMYLSFDGTQGITKSHAGFCCRECMGCALCANLVHARASERHAVAPISPMLFTLEQADAAAHFVLEEHMNSIENPADFKAVHRLAGVQPSET